MRSKGARKDSTVNNFTDTYNHLWDRSRPTIVLMERRIQKRSSKIVVQSEIEWMIEGLFLGEENC